MLNQMVEIERVLCLAGLLPMLRCLDALVKVR